MLSGGRGLQACNVGFGLLFTSPRVSNADISDNHFYLELFKTILANVLILVVVILR
jgi:hypothetical protein